VGHCRSAMCAGNPARGPRLGARSVTTKARGRLAGASNRKGLVGGPGPSMPTPCEGATVSQPRMACIRRRPMAPRPKTIIR
jgi:hypothetical protein